MDFRKFIHCIRSDTRRRILQLLSERDMSAPQAYEKLGKNAPKYKRSVNRALEILRECGLVTKYYSNENKAIYYHLGKKTYVLKIAEMKIE